MLGGAQRRAGRMRHIEGGRPFEWTGSSEKNKPDWENAPYVYVGASNATSYNHKQSGAYRTKDARPAVTGAYKKDKTLSMQGSLAANLMAAFGSRALGKSSGTTRGK